MTRRQHPVRFGFAYAALLLVAGTVVVGCALSLAGTIQVPGLRLQQSRPVSSEPGCPEAIPQTLSERAAGATLALFIRGGILRVDTVCAWDVSATEVRGDAPRTAWASDNAALPVTPYPTRHRARFRYPCGASDPGPCVAIASYSQAKEGLRFVVLLRAPDARPAELHYLIVLTAREGRWQVTYAQPLASAGGPLAS